MVIRPSRRDRIGVVDGLERCGSAAVGSPLRSGKPTPCGHGAHEQEPGPHQGRDPNAVDERGPTGIGERDARRTAERLGHLERAGEPALGLRREIGGYRAEDRLIDLMENAPARSGLDRAQYADLKFWLPGDILTKVDRTSMAVSLEAREPLLDHRLIEFAASLPESLRVRGMQGKYLLKKAMRRYLPNDILYRPKQGFVTPIAPWLRGPLSAEARAISTRAARMSSIAEAHIAGRSDHSRLLWQMLMLDRSLRHLGVVS